MAYTAFWIAEAQAKLKNIPYFVRAQARKRLEDVAREQQAEQITPQMVEQVRVEFGQQRKHPVS